MTATIEDLEKEKLELEERNAQTIKANRDLLNELEQLNDNIATSDAQVQALTDTLHSTEEDIQRLSSLAARTQLLERQLIDLEKEQTALHEILESKIGDERTAIQRWHQAEKTIGDLQDQIDRIEKEAREERERHVEIVARMERRMAVDGELATAAGRLKAKTGQDKAGTGVVSHFVKDILLDNANLQHGILELREMLLSSNEEVERLREMLRVHQPIFPTNSEDNPTPTLQKELSQKDLDVDRVFNQELHIHHHYHGAKKDIAKGQAHRRPKKKRYNLTPTHFTPPALPAPPDQSSSAILAHTTATVPPNMNRWSNATTLAGSSIPGSPLSISHRGSSIHERVFSDVAYDSSWPTSPSESVDLSSPMFAPSDIATTDFADFNHRKRPSQSLKPPSLSTIRSSSSPISLTTKSSPATAVISTLSPPNSFTNDVFTLSPSLQPTIPEESEESPETHSLTSPNSESEDAISPTQIRPKLRRAASHESLISISGMDIHTLQSRPSQLFLSTSPRFSSPASGTSSQPVLTPWTATASASISRRHLDSSTLNRSLLYSTLMAQKRGASETYSSSPLSSSITKRVGGWVFGKWGTSPMPTPSRPTSSSTQNSNSSQSGKSGEETPKERKEAKKEVQLRPAGVNQSGPIWGFFDVPPTPTKVVVTNLDAEALGEALAES
ncbi:hypothetical protein CC78DRAFT_537755 [Lojkania enalia]|uniref:Uncharacterized protein n=1 Tax=Lojkania enalia TaxID=147567 RepID=A0A9P4JXV9_9PLEO|nr:hypothetical protein CC78DRAFT_537755 [Didymosphaeria enalia]